MNQMQKTVLEKHAALLTFWDAARQDSAEIPQIEGRRLERAHVIAIVGGSLGLRTAALLAQMPIGNLTVLGIRPQDVSNCKPIENNPANQVRNILVSHNGYVAPGISIAFSSAHLVVVATDRPHPKLYREINEVAVRMGTAVTFGRFWNANFMLGPTVIPGVTACHHCFTSRIRANVRHIDVHDAIEQFLINDPDFRFTGQLSVITQIGAAYLAEEVARFLGGAESPIALSQLFTFNTLAQFQEFDYVVPLEWCTVCHERHQIAARGNPEEDSLAMMVQRQQQFAKERA